MGASRCTSVREYGFYFCTAYNRPPSPLDVPRDDTYREQFSSPLPSEILPATGDVVRRYTRSEFYVDPRTRQFALNIPLQDYRYADYAHRISICLTFLSAPDFYFTERENERERNVNFSKVSRSRTNLPATLAPSNFSKSNCIIAINHNCDSRERIRALDGMNSSGRGDNDFDAG